MYTSADYNMFLEHKNELYRFKGKYGDSCGKLLDRIHDVLRVIHEAFGHGSDHFNWWFEDADEGEVGELCITGDDVTGYYLTSNCSLKTTKRDYGYSFPVNFLFMSNEDIIAQIHAEIESDQHEKARRSQKQKLDRQKREELKKSAIEKLTDEERRALGFK